jgi:amidohydrolase
MKNEKILQEAQKISDWIIEHRRTIHRHPEPSRREYKTSAYVKETLEGLGVEVKTGYYETGLCGIIRGKNPGPTIGLRFDMDALEIQEENEHEYVSQNKGVMHACGHDGHTSMGLGVAKLLSNMTDDIYGIVKLVFQPAEEDAPRGGGAQHMIADGIMEDPKIDFMLGMHLWPTLPFGTIGTKAGPLMASSDPFNLTIRGKGAHASMPNTGVDPILAGSHLVTSLQSIVSRNVDPFEQAVVTIGVFQGGTRYNVIPETVKLEGTVRTFSEEVRQLVYEKIKLLTENTAKAFGTTVDLNYKMTYPPLINDSELVEEVFPILNNLIGEENVVRVERGAPGGEDFAFFAREVPSVFMFLGYDKGDGKTVQVHNPKFDFDDTVLSKGVAAFVELTLKLGRKKI